MILRSFPSLPTWTAGLRELDTARRDMEQILQSLTDRTGAPPAGVFPAIRVSETDDTVLVRAELPGVKSDALDLTVEHGTLTIAGERDTFFEDDGAACHRREREWGAFRRSVSLPTRIDPDRVEARYADGILTVALPKAAEVRPRQIPVQAEA